MTRTTLQEILENVPDSQRKRHASLIDLAVEVHPMIGQTVIVHGCDLGRLMGVASDVSDLYYVIEKRNGNVYWASAVGWISSLKDRLPDAEYRACHVSEDEDIEMQIILDDGLDRIWLSGTDPLEGQNRGLENALIHCRSVIVDQARSMIDWIPAHLKRRLADVYPANDPRIATVRGRIGRPDFIDMFLSEKRIDLPKALDILDSVHRRETAKVGERFREGLHDFSDHVIAVGGEDVGDIIGKVRDIPIREISADAIVNVSGHHMDMARMLWPDRDFHHPDDTDWNVVEHLVRVSPYTDHLLRDWLRENRWVIDCIEEHRAAGRLEPDWVPAAYFCAAARPHLLKKDFPGNVEDLETILSDVASRGEN